MKIIGLHVHAGQSAACLCEKGSIVAGAAEERFNRIKQSRAFPNNSIQFCLKKAGVSTLEELDGIAVSWNPANNMKNINLSGFTQWRRYDPEWLYIVPNNLLNLGLQEGFPGESLKMDIDINLNCPLHFVDHHRSHLGHAIFQSPFEQGAAAIIDEYGEYYSVTLARFLGNKVEIIRQIPYPHSLGIFYAAITEYLGFRPNSDEWKVMGAAAYGEPERFQNKVEKLLLWNESDCEWIIDQRYIEHANMKRAGYLNERLKGFLGIPVRGKDDEIKQVHYDLAAAAQAVFEDRLFRLLNCLYEETGEKNLCVAGGSFMNSLANGKILNRTPFERVFIPYAAADNGGAMGAALWVYHCVFGNRREIIQNPPSPFIGPSWDDDEINRVIKKFKLHYEYCEHPDQSAAEEIATGHLVGWFQGAMEYGERALGARSILADPREASMKEKINSAVKYREAFRPFAPSVLMERVADFFDLPSGASVPYMEQVYPVRLEMQSVIPAVVHADGTGRLQTVSRDMNPLYYDLIKQFEEITGVPVVLNTSFNIQGEPIVCSPEDAIRTFFSCGLDTLIIGRYILRK
ncbi:MAG: Decarbamoylnovobiocin carbamoyltransferase [Pelotomaculum sp. PtaU1.Bin065]|nr:MAG: Decarbamoylnovobiocin carbamoyltransferase [Pelotomaculum sp. PtaU1.Bin065]